MLEFHLHIYTPGEYGSVIKLLFGAVFFKIYLGMQFNSSAWQVVESATHVYGALHQLVISCVRFFKHVIQVRGRFGSSLFLFLNHRRRHYAESLYLWNRVVLSIEVVQPHCMIYCKFAAILCGCRLTFCSCRGIPLVDYEVYVKPLHKKEKCVCEYYFTHLSNRPWLISRGEVLCCVFLSYSLHFCLRLLVDISACSLVWTPTREIDANSWIDPYLVPEA